MTSLVDIQDKGFEDEITKHPYNIKTWLNYIDHKKSSKAVVRYRIYERALKIFPRSYKLWHMYLNEKTKKLRYKCITDKKYDVLESLFERALVTMNKMPVIWVEYCMLLVKLRKGPLTRKVFDRALQALPITQHRCIWDIYIEWAIEFGSPQTAVCVYRRYIMFNPSSREKYIDYLETNEHYKEAVKQLIICIDDEQFVSTLQNTKHSMWMRLCDICALHPLEIGNIPVDAIIRSGIVRFTDEVGRLWCRLADYYIRMGLFEKARDVYEEAIHEVITVRDFTLVFEAYAKFEESVLTTKINLTLGIEEKLGMDLTSQLDEYMENTPSHSLNDLISTFKLKAILKSAKVGMNDFEQYYTDKKDIILRLIRLEHLMSQRPMLLNAVVLRQNPNNVYEWHKRIRLYLDEFLAHDHNGSEDSKEISESVEAKSIALQRVITTYMEAIQAIQPKLAKGKFSTLWLSLAKFYEEHYSDDIESNIENARSIFRKATGICFKTVDECALIWTSWAEMEIFHQNYEKALVVMQEAITEPTASIRRRKQKAAHAGSQKVTLSTNNARHYDYNESSEAFPTTERVFMNIKVWELYLDLEESLGTLDMIRSAYDRAMDLNIITPLMVLNYTALLEQHHYFEDSFKIYERAINIFGYPHVKPIWTVYLEKFMARYQGKKLERLRDLYEQALKSGPPLPDRVEYYLLYSKAEEKFGLPRHALAVLDRATKDPLITDDMLKFNLYKIFIYKTELFYGATKTRVIYERAIQELNDDSTCSMCIEFAAMETKLGEIDRARVIYIHASQYVDPKKDQHKFWTHWRNFEELYGNEDTFRDMLRMKRSAEVAYSQVNYMASEMAAATSGGSSAGDADVNASGGDSMARLAAKREREAESMQFVSSTSNVKAVAEKPTPSTSTLSNKDQYEFGFETEKVEMDEDDEPEVEQKAVPDAVFGSLAAGEPPKKSRRLE